ESVLALLAFPLGNEDTTNVRVDEIAQSVHRRHSAVVAAGRRVSTFGAVDLSLRESRQVADALRGTARPKHGVHRLEGVHLPGLLTLLADDDRLRLYVTRELQPLIEYDTDHGTALLSAVRALVTNPRGKAAAAASLHLSRPAFYDRIARAESVLGRRLDDPDV